MLGTCVALSPEQLEHVRVQAGRESGPALAVQPVIDALLLGQAPDLDAIDAEVDAKRHELWRGVRYLRRVLEALQ